ncbi:MAG: GGDEF domain-containing protein [Alphaproteobacteria bacterium]|nr:GGDEF domain-containing protein [Alphaproteobacteria bacterium]
MTLAPHLSTPPADQTLTETARQAPLELRLVLALAGERELNAREQAQVEKLQAERGEGLYADMMYALTHKSFPTKQAKILWAEISQHRAELLKKLGRDPGIPLAAHDYLTNVAGLMKHTGLIEEQKFNLLATTACRDGLTGLYDKTTFTRLLAEELHRQGRYQRPVTLVLADIDHFKKLNDTFGHADGDAVLAQVAEIIAQAARSTDVCGRFGGEEFAVYLPEVGAEAGARLAERIRANVEQAFATTAYLCTVSLGVAAGQPGVALEDLVRAADTALYASKHAGRNRFSLATEVVTQV